MNKNLNNNNNLYKNPNLYYDIFLKDQYLILPNNIIHIILLYSSHIGEHFIEKCNYLKNHNILNIINNIIIDLIQNYIYFTKTKYDFMTSNFKINYPNSLFYLFSENESCYPRYMIINLKIHLSIEELEMKYSRPSRRNSYTDWETIYRIVGKYNNKVKKKLLELFPTYNEFFDIIVLIFENKFKTLLQLYKLVNIKNKHYREFIKNLSTK